jgi:hypothetical protein
MKKMYLNKDAMQAAMKDSELPFHEQCVVSWIVDRVNEYVASDDCCPPWLLWVWDYFMEHVGPASKQAVELFQGREAEFTKRS